MRREVKKKLSTWYGLDSSYSQAQIKSGAKADFMLLASTVPTRLKESFSEFFLWVISEFSMCWWLEIWKRGNFVNLILGHEANSHACERSTDATVNIVARWCKQGWLFSHKLSNDLFMAFEFVISLKASKSVEVMLILMSFGQKFTEKKIGKLLWRSKLFRRRKLFGMNFWCEINDLTQSVLSNLFLILSENFKQKGLKLHHVSF